MLVQEDVPVSDFGVVVCSAEKYPENLHQLIAACRLFEPRSCKSALEVHQSLCKSLEEF